MCTDFHKHHFFLTEMYYPALSTEDMHGPALPIQEYVTKFPSTHSYCNPCLLRKECLCGVKLNFDIDSVLVASNILLIVLDRMSIRVAAGRTLLH